MDHTPPTHKPRPLIDLAVSIVIPSVILMNFSGDEELGAARALVAALAFPLGWGAFELLRYRKFNFIALLGLVGVLLTGGIGLLELDPKWLAVKEAAIPGVIGVAVLISTHTRFPLIRAMVMNRAVLDVDNVRAALDAHGSTPLFEKRLKTANYLFAGTFLFSSIMNYVLAKWIVVSPAGSAAFNEELGRMTLLSYPVIAVPSMVMLVGILVYLWYSLKRLTGLELERILVQGRDRS